MSEFIQVQGLSKIFEEADALTDVSLTIPEGDFLVVVGSNGAGKSTLLRLIGGLYYPDKGTITISGLDRYEDHLAIKKFTAYLDDQPQVLCNWSGRAQIEIAADIYGVPRKEIIEDTEQLVALFNLGEVIDKPPMTYSKGQLKKLSIATAFVSRARLFLLDEPFTGGIDPIGHRTLKQMLGELGKRPEKTVIMTTQVLDLVEDLAQHLLVIDQGRILFHGTPDEARARAGTPESTLEEAVTKLTSAKLGANPEEVAKRLFR